MGITLYAPNCTDFSTLGEGLLQPISCTIKAQAAGQYELTLEHPIDPDSLRWAQLENGCVVKAPVPTRESPDYESDAEGGSATTVSRSIYRVTTGGKRLRLRQNPGMSAKVLGSYKPGTEVVKLDEDGSWMKVSVRVGGAVGWMYASNLTFVETIEEVIDGQQSKSRNGVRPVAARDQLFRLNKPEIDSGKLIVTAEGVHISYDLLGNMIEGTVTAEQKAADAVITEAMGKLQNPNPDFTVHAPNLTDAIDGEWSYISPIEFLLDPENGVAAKTGAMVVRDNFDIWLLPDAVRDTGVTIRRRKNLAAVRVTKDDTNVITRITPVGKDEDGEDLFAPDGSGHNYVDSPNIGAYPYIRSKRVDYDVKVVKKDADNEKTFTNKSDAQVKLRQLAAAEFSENGADLITYGMEVDFELLSQAEGYEDYAALQSIALYDTVTVIDELIGLQAKVRVTGYEWDCIARRYTRVTLGALTDLKQTVYSYQLSGGISGTKILPNSLSGNALRSLTVDYAKIGQATIARLMAESITAVTARIAELVADQITTDELYANIAEIGKAQINTANIVSANIDWASINTLATNIAAVCFASIGDANITSANIENLRAGMAKIMSARISALDAETADVNKLYADTARMLTAIISDANITTAQIGQLSAEIANMVSVSAKLASYDFESVKALLANTLQVDRVDGDLMTIRNLLVNSASMVNAVIGDLVVKATNGHYYRIDIGNDGTLNSMDVTSNLTPSEIAAAETKDGKKIVETDLTVTDLEAENIGAASAMITEIITKSLTAGAITAGEALIGSATIPTLYATVIKAIGDTLDLSANGSVRIKAGSGLAGDVQSMINASADGIVLQAKTATMNDIELGGTNLVRLKEGTVSITTGSIIDTTDDYWYTRSRKYLRMTAYSGAYNVLRFDSQIPIVSGRQYVVSFNAWCYQIPDAEREAIILRVNLTAAGDPDGVIYDRIRNLKNGAPTRYSVPFTATQSGNLALRLYTIEPWTAGQLDITDVKLEEGTIPSKWSPNPLDIEERMSAAELKITDSAIVATVTQSAAYTGDISRVEQKADGVTTTVQNLRVGATNLARLGTDLVTVQTGSVINTTDDYWHTRSRKYLRMAAFSGAYNVVRFNSPIPIHPATYTLSFNAWTYGVPAAEREAIVLRCNLYGGAEGHDITFKTLTGLREGAPTRYTATFVAPDDLNELMVLRFLTFTPWTQGQLDITDVMFEQGTLASEWSPSPMDVDERLSAAELKITDSAIVSTVRSSSQYAADLAGKASATEMSQVQQKITDSAIVNTVRQSTAYQNDLGAKANASDVQANYALKSALTQTATDIRAEVNAVYSGSANLLRLADGLVTVTTGSVANAPNTDNYWYLRSRKYLHMAAFTGTYNVLRFNSSIPIVSGKEYTLSFNAWTYQISDTEREAIILRVNLTTEGDGVGTTYGRITGLKNQNPTRYTLTFTATASGIMALRLITNEPWSAGRLEITDVKLEEGNKATGWSPHPEEFRSGSSIEITNDRIQMTSGEIDFYGSELAAAQEDAIVQITDDGMSATSVTAPDVMPVYTGDATLTASKPGDLAAIFQRLSHKVITRNITINVSVNQSGNATLYGALGGAQITVNGGNHTLSGQLSLIRCTVYPTFTGLKVVARGASALRQYGAFYAQYNSCSFETVSTASPAYVADLMHGARGFFNACELLSYSGLALLSLNYGTDGTMFNCTGGTTGAFLRTAGCSFKGSGTRPIGTHTGANTSLLAPGSPTSLATAAGSYNGSTPSPSTDVVTTASFTPTHRRSYGGGSWTEDSSNLLRHGIMNGKSHVGCMWFDLTSLAGKTLTGATLTLSRNAAGPARADVWLKTINLAYGSGMSNPNSAPVLWVASPEDSIGEVVRKQESSFDLDKDALTGLISSDGVNRAALMLYCTDDEAMGSHSYSSNYASYDSATLTVSYK